MSLEQEIREIAVRSKAAGLDLMKRPLSQLDGALESMAIELERNKASILSANALDLEAAAKRGISGAMLERLKIKDSSFQTMVEGIRQVIRLQNPLGKTIREWDRPNGLKIKQVRVPIGVIGIIYESRPNVTVDASVLCLKTGNAVILRGGSEAIHSNQALAKALQAGAKQAGLSEDVVQLVPMTDREAIPLLCRQDDCIDLMIPRGGEGLIRAVTEHARMPVIKHFNGICHVYVHEAADFEMAEKIILNGKCQRPGVCNAVETLLIDQKIASTFIPRIVSKLRTNHVEIRGDEETRRLGGDDVNPASEADWGTEYLDLILSVKVVQGIDEAIDHMEKYGSKHSDVIVTRDEKVAEKFLNEVDSATVYWNASTRFTDGGEFGFGAEIGISTDKLHARGPMGLDELTSYKYQIVGNGQTRG
jgi:glutamate-5-semialdehyde dehydrogenase